MQHGEVCPVITKLIVKVMQHPEICQLILACPLAPTIASKLLKFTASYPLP